jgi:hypothetical protein
MVSGGIRLSGFPAYLDRVHSVSRAAAIDRVLAYLGLSPRYSARHFATVV